MSLTRASSVTIRPARQSDAERLAELSGELGYPATREEIGERLRRMKPTRQHAVLVAERRRDGKKREVIGWLHVSVSYLVEVETRAEVNGLVVGEGQRSQGAGARLLRAAETWARRRGCRSMSVRSNVIRERAHQFYLRQGYEHYKTQKAFRKTL